MWTPFLTRKNKKINQLIYVSKDSRGQKTLKSSENFMTWHGDDNIISWSVELSLQTVKGRYWEPLQIKHSSELGVAPVTVNWCTGVLYCTFFLYSSALQSCLDFTALFRPLCRVPLSLPRLWEPKWCELYAAGLVDCSYNRFMWLTVDDSPSNLSGILFMVIGQSLTKVIQLT